MAKKGRPNKTAAEAVPSGPGSSGLCGACAGSGVKPGRWMSPCDGPCPMCAGRGHGGRAAGVPPERYMDWILDGCRATPSAGAPADVGTPSALRPPAAITPTGGAEVLWGGKGRRVFRRLINATVGAVMFASGLGALLRFRRRRPAKLAGWPVRGRVRCKFVEDSMGQGYIILDRDDEELGELRFDGAALRSGPMMPGRLYTTYEEAVAVCSAINSLLAAPSGRSIAPPWA